MGNSKLTTRLNHFVVRRVLRRQLPKAPGVIFLTVPPTFAEVRLTRVGPRMHGTIGKEERMLAYRCLVSAGLALIGVTAWAQNKPDLHESPRHTVIFFDWASVRIAPNGIKRIATAAQHAKELGSKRVRVVGFTDTGLPDAEALEMSKKTAAAVGKELLKDGVPEDAIFVAGFGKESPIKPTKDGVLEPYNRRVEIFIE